MVYTNVGRNQLRNFLYGSSPTPPAALAWGTNTTAATVANTTLGAEITPRTTFTSSAITDQEVKFESVLVSTTGNANTISELGLFSSTAGTSGNMYLRQAFAGIGKTTASDITAEVTIRFTGVD